jgi:hypothetical protein
VVVRKAATLHAAPPPRPQPRPPLLEELLLPAGRATLTQLFRVHGGRRPRLVAAIAASHRRADGAPIGDADLDAVLEHHGLERTYTRRERDELLHAVRAAGGLLARAAAALGHQPEALAEAITRLGLDAEVRRLREARRRELRTRATLSERAQLLVGSTDALADLGLLEEFERDLTLRLPEHLRALSTTGEPLELGLARTLGLPGATVAALMARLQVDLRAPAIRPQAAAGAAAVAATSRTPRRPDAGSAGGTLKKSQSRPRPSGSRPSGSRPPGSRPPGSRPPGSRPPGARPGPPRRPGQGGGRRGPGR